MIAVFVNMATVLVGSFLGILFRNRLKESFQNALMKALALCTVVIGVSSAIQTKELLCVILSMVLGTVIGELLRIDDGIEHAGDAIKEKLFHGGFARLDVFGRLEARGFAHRFLQAVGHICVVQVPFL